MPEAREARQPHEVQQAQGLQPTQQAQQTRQAQEAEQTQESQQPREPHEAEQTQGLQQAQQAQQGRDGAAVRQFVEHFASLLADSGMPRMPARIFVALLTADTSRLTAEELAGLLRVSPAAVSGGVRYLVQVGLVSRETEPGSRRHVYRMPENVWHEVLRVRDRIMMRWADTMRGGAEVLGPGTPAGARLAESALYFEFVSKELPALLDRWEDFKTAHQG